MKQKIYIETSLPSFYFEIRNDPEMVAMRAWTKNWWDSQRNHYELVTSIPVIEECVPILTTPFELLHWEEK